jgi:1-deoxy-D-xylulose-5-phosphate reductoisomerase
LDDESIKRVAILGSTGSIGRSTLEVVDELDGRVGIVGLAARRNIEDLRTQITRYRPLKVAVGEETLADRLREVTGELDVSVLSGAKGLNEIATMVEADLVVNALVGAAGIVPTLSAIEAGKDVALANKECLVAAGQIIVREAGRSRANIIPVDSEHSAIYQCLRGEARGSVKRIILTASGGPFVDIPAKVLAGVRAEEALRHPTWDMGKKVTIDSATLLNKGFEVIEAHWLFGMDVDNIEVVVERKSIVHSLVEFVDGVVIALLSCPDMRLPIQYALTFPDRVATSNPTLDATALGQITFEAPDHDRFPSLGLAYRALRVGGTVPAALSAADEVAVQAFLDGQIVFGEIYPILEEVVSYHKAQDAGELETVLEADRWARAKAKTLIQKISGRA